MNNFDIENLNTKLERHRKVFVPNISVHDFSSAEIYGELTPVSKGELNRFSVGTMARRWMKHLLDSKKDDYIIVTSLTILTCIGCAIFGHLHGRLNVLLFKNGRYIARNLDFKYIRKEIEDGHESQSGSADPSC